MGTIYDGVKMKYALKWNNILNRADRLLLKVYEKTAFNKLKDETPIKIASYRSYRFMKKLPGTEESQVLIQQMMDSDSPYAVIRFGLYEYILCRQFLELQNHLRKDYSDFIRYHIAMDAGMFSNTTEGMNFYARKVLDNLPNADMIGYWRNYPEGLICNSFFKKNVKHLPIEEFYPYPFWHFKKLPTWQQNLKGKKILVVSAFSKSVEKQYRKRKKIWGEDSDKILPEFQLISFQAVQTSGGAPHDKYNSWEAALEDMLDRILAIKFDIALISCGSYGIPLALEIKKAGKNAIQWGGCFQLWFGIMGKRWENDKVIQQYINPAWTYPAEDERPPLAEKVGNGSYWKNNSY